MLEYDVRGLAFSACILMECFWCSVPSFSVQAQFVLSQFCPDRRSVFKAHLRCWQLCVQSVEERRQTCGVWRQVQLPRCQQTVVNQPPGPQRLGRVRLHCQQRFKLWVSKMQPPNLLLVPTTVAALFDMVARTFKGIVFFFSFKMDLTPRLSSSYQQRQSLKRGSG